MSCGVGLFGLVLVVKGIGDIDKCVLDGFFVLYDFLLLMDLCEI